MQVRVVADYALEDFAPGKDRVTLVFKARGGRTWEPKQYKLPQAQGQVVFEIAADVLLREPSLVRPVQALLVLDREEAPGKIRGLRATDLIFFAATPIAEDDARIHDAKQLSPQI